MPFKNKKDRNDYMRRYMKERRETTKKFVELGKKYAALVEKGFDLK